MLVLSRSTSDRISFPSLGISIEVLKVAGNRASLGIDAPKHVRVIRDELLDEDSTRQLEDARTESAGESDSRHEYRNRLNRALLSLNLAGKLIEQGETEQGLAALSSGLSGLSQLEASGSNQRSSLTPPKSEQGAASTISGDGFGEVDARVLLVDDDENERVLMASYLRRSGIEVTEASDGLQALYALAKDPKPDAVLLDMKMPNLDGPRTVNRIRSSTSYPNLPIYAVTGESAESLGMEVGTLGVNGWFRKPIDIEQVIAAIKESAAVLRLQ